MEDNGGGWSENPLHGKKKHFHNIQPREEHSPVYKCVTGAVYMTKFSVKNRKLFMHFACSFTQQRHFGDWKRIFLKMPLCRF